MGAPRDSVARGLLLSCHPIPTVAVTAMATVLVASAGNDLAVVVVAGVAVLTGQLSIGWSNDLIDVRRDIASGRADKPLATGGLSSRTVVAATAVALVVTTAASLALGWRAGVVQLCVVLGGWVYNLGLKSMAVSPVPFFVSFGALPAVATLALDEPAWPPGWAFVAGGLIGVAAHFGNVLPDLDEDEATAVQGLPHRLGRSTSAIVASACAVAAAAIAVVGADPPMRWAVVALVAAVGLAVGGLVVVRRRPRSEAAFFTSMAVAAIGVAVIAATGALA